MAQIKVNQIQQIFNEILKSVQPNLTKIFWSFMQLTDLVKQLSANKYYGFTTDQNSLPLTNICKHFSSQFTCNNIIFAVIISLVQQ
jgi:hypothetical protein